MQGTVKFIVFDCHYCVLYGVFEVGINVPSIQQLIQKNLRSFIIVKTHCSMTHLKEQKSFGFI